MVRVLADAWPSDVGFAPAKDNILSIAPAAGILTSWSGWGVFGIGPQIIRCARYVEPGPCEHLPISSKMDGVRSCRPLAERLLALFPSHKVFFTNSGAEAVEAAIKFARRATRRPGIVYCDTPSMV